MGYAFVQVTMVVFCALYRASILTEGVHLKRLKLNLGGLFMMSSTNEYVLFIVVFITLCLFTFAARLSLDMTYDIRTYVLCDAPKLLIHN